MMTDDEVDTAVARAMTWRRTFPSEGERRIYRAGYAAGQAAAVPREHPSDAELALWKALGRWSAEICRLDAELAPPQYLLDAVAALGAGAEGAK